MTSNLSSSKQTGGSTSVENSAAALQGMTTTLLKFHAQINLSLFVFWPFLLCNSLSNLVLH